MEFILNDFALKHGNTGKEHKTLFAGSWLINL